MVLYHISRCSEPGPGETLQLMKVALGVTLNVLSFLLSFPQPTDGMDAVAMTIVNCVAVVYVYTQFKSLSKTGSKYILGQCLGG